MFKRGVRHADGEDQAHGIMCVWGRPCAGPERTRYAHTGMCVITHGTTSLEGASRPGQPFVNKPCTRLHHAIRCCCASPLCFIQRVHAPCKMQGEQLPDRLTVPRLKLRKHWYKGLDPQNLGTDHSHPDVGDGGEGFGRSMGG